ncbi:hypothetical protein RUND412_004134 [Rhizina undulata]
MGDARVQKDGSHLRTTDKIVVLTGKQEHYLKRELISRQVKFEIAELNSPTALQRFGAPFGSPLGEVRPVDSELPILRYIFVHHVRNFPFLDQAREKEFWQDRLQVFLESFATKRISSSEDRLEETKRRKLALKCEKVVELMMNSGIPTASGYEERVGFEEIEAAGGADRGAHEGGLVANLPEGHVINGWDVNVASVRQTSVKRTVRYHTHAEFILRVKQPGKPDVVVGRRYGDFARLHRAIRSELPGKILPTLPRKNRSSENRNFLSTMSSDDRSSISSGSTRASTEIATTAQLRTPTSNRHSRSISASLGLSSRNSSQPEISEGQPVKLWRENQRITLRAFIRTLLADEKIARSKTMNEFLLKDPIKLNGEEMVDEERRRSLDKMRVEEQRKFYEIARQRARELDVYMESFRKEIVESNGLTKLFAEIRKKDKLSDLSIQYKKFAEWLRIEVAATIYHLFLAEDNSPELFTQAKRIHSLIPYTLLKNVIRLANPAAVMTGVLDLFLATPFGSRSLMQRILSLALNDGIHQLQKGVDSLVVQLDDPIICEKLHAFTEAEEDVRDGIRAAAQDEQIDLIVAILTNEDLGPELQPSQTERVYNGWVAWYSAIENIEEEMKTDSQFFSHLKQLLKLYTRQRDKNMMLAMISEPVTLKLFKDLFMIFYEPLIRVYKSANVYNSVTDFAVFVEDMIQVVEQAQNMVSDPNQTVQAFIDLCARHEDNFYKFVHEVHIHDNGLFDKLMGWLEGILSFLRHGPAGGKLDMNKLMQEAVEAGTVDLIKAKEEIDKLINWHARRRKWHEDKTRQKMASGGDDLGWSVTGPENAFRSSDFGVDQADIEEINEIDNSREYGDEDDMDDAADPLEVERHKRELLKDQLKRRSGEPEKPEVTEILKLKEAFLLQLRMVLAD